MNRIALPLLLLLTLTRAALAAPPIITTQWIDGQRVEICTAASGALYVAGAWAWVGDVTTGCRVYPPDGTLVDVTVAPAPGVRYCLWSGSVMTCAEPLPRPLLPRAWLPTVAR